MAAPFRLFVRTFDAIQPPTQPPKGGGGGKGGGKGGGGGGGSPPLGTADLGWAVIDTTGTVTVLDSFNVTSVNDDGAGLFTVTWTNAFTSANYVVCGTTKIDSSDPLTGASHLMSLQNVASNPLVGSAKIGVTFTNNVASDSDVVCVLATRNADSWVTWDASSGTPTVLDSLNVSSLTDGGVGIVTIVWDTDFANGNYTVVGSGKKDASGAFIHYGSHLRLSNTTGHPLAGSVKLYTMSPDQTPQDSTFFSVLAIDDTASPFVDGWAQFDARTTGAPVVGASQNVSSITDNGVGDYTLVWDTDFADANYIVAGSVRYDDSNEANHFYVGIRSTASNPAAGSVRVTTWYTGDLNRYDPYYASFFATKKE